MKVKLQNGQTASEQEIQALETTLGCPLSDSFRTFVRTYDGARPEPNLFRISHNYSFAVNRFIPVSEIPKARRYLDNLQTCAYPVARDDCGNYVFIDEDKDGAVVFWDHELPDDPVQLASNFQEFLGALEPDTTTVQLKPGQVKKVWVDPEFLKKLKK